MTFGQRKAVGAVVALFALLFVSEGALLPTAWLPLEESAALADARGTGSVASAGSILYPFLIGPFARSLSPSNAYTVAQALSAVLWALAAIPTYLLARRLLSPRASLVVAAVAVAAPGAVYATAAVPDALALLLGLCSLPLVARAAATGSRRDLAGALAFAAAAALTRPWFVVLPPALLVAHELSRIGPRTFLRWPGALAFAGFAAFAYLVLAISAPEIGGVVSDPRSIARAGAASLVVVAVGGGIVPWLLTAAGARSGAARPEAAMLTLCLLALTVTAGVFGATGGGVDERPLLVLVPLVLVLGASAWIAREVQYRVAVVAGALLVLAALTLPTLGRAPAAHAAGLGLAGVPSGSRAFVVVAIAVLAALSVAALRVLRRPAALLAVPALLLLAGHAAAWTSVHAGATALASSELAPRGWVDRHVPSTSAVYVVGPAAALGAENIAALRLWNRAVRGTRVLDLSIVDPKTGLLPVSDTSLVLERGVRLVGTEIAGSAAGELLNASLPLQELATVEGLFADGWSGPQAVYRRFSGPPKPGTVRITVSRAAWSGTDRAGNVSIAVGPLSGTVVATAKGVIHAAQQHAFDVAVPAPPFQVVVTITPTFAPSEFGAADQRQLGAQLSFAYRA
ncbi:MAG: glycosyltransferase family 39 protein [Gaiellaceae bacterium]